MASITPPFGPIKRISGFKLDSAPSTFSDSSTCKSSQRLPRIFRRIADTASQTAARETNSIQSISPNMLSAPVQLGSSYEPRSGLWSSFTAGDEPSPGVSRGAGSQTYFSEDGHLPGSVPFSTSFTTTVNQPSSQAEASQSRHAHSLSMPLFSPDTSAPLLMSHLASYGAKNDAEASFYPNYVHESWSPSLTPATGKAPSSRSRSQRRSSLGSPHLGSGADDIPKSQIPRTAEQRSGAFYRRQSIASDMLAFRSNQIAPSQPSSMPTDPIPPRPDMSWMREFNSDRFPELSKDSPALFDQYQSGSAPGSLNLPSLLHFDRLLPSPEGDASSKPYASFFLSLLSQLILMSLGVPVPQQRTNAKSVGKVTTWSKDDAVMASMLPSSAFLSYCPKCCSSQAGPVKLPTIQPKCNCAWPPRTLLRSERQVRLC